MNDEDSSTQAATPAAAESVSGEPTAAPVVGDDASSTPASATQHLPFPSSSDLNTRIRRIITTYQKLSRRRSEAAAAALERVSCTVARSCD